MEEAQTAEQLAGKGKQAYEKNNLPDAIRLFGASAVAYEQAGNHADALKLLDELLRGHPESVRLRDAKLLWATSTIGAGRAVGVPPFLVELSARNDAEACPEYQDPEAWPFSRSSRGASVP